MTLPEIAIFEKPAPAAIAPLTYSIQGAAKALGVSLPVMRRLLSERKIRSVRAGARVLIPRAEIDNFLALAE